MGGIERFDVDSNKFIENLTNIQIHSTCNSPPLDDNFIDLPQRNKLKWKPMKTVMRSMEWLNGVKILLFLKECTHSFSDSQ